MSIKERWAGTLSEFKSSMKAGQPDASSLAKVEKYLRRAQGLILGKTAARYGNREAKRVRNRYEGTTEYLNAIWNYIGSQLRYLGMVRYPFPRPNEIEMADGLWKLGHKGSSKNPKYIYIHQTMPELDFVDMIRGLCNDLGWQCFRYSVPLRDAKRYVCRLILRLIPFLDHVYTEGIVGRSDFGRGALKELSRVVRKIKARYRMRNGRLQTLTSRVVSEMSTHHDSDWTAEPTDPEGHPETVEPDESRPFKDFLTEGVTAEELFVEQFDRAEKESDKNQLKHVKTARLLYQNEILRDCDAVELVRQTKNDRRVVGIALHDFLAYSVSRALSLTSVIYHGDSIAYDGMDFLLVSEVPVQGGRGRVDFVLFRRKQIEYGDFAAPRTIWEPCMVIELKTKSAQNWDLYGIETKSKDSLRRVREYIIERRKLTRDEWDQVLVTTPTEYERRQVELYAQTILDEYHSKVWWDPDPPQDISCAILVVDPKDNWDLLRDSLIPLVETAFADSLQTRESAGVYYHPRKAWRDIRMGLFPLSIAFERDTNPLERHTIFNAFQNTKDDDRHVILYVSAYGRGSPAASAATISSRWHTVREIHKRCAGQRKEVVWLDLAGEYPNRALVRSRLYLTQHTASVRRFVERRVKFVNLLEDILDYLDGRSISQLMTKLETIFEHLTEGVLIVTGWDALRNATPASELGVLEELMLMILEWIPNGATLFWSETAKPIAETSPIYEQNCIVPFYSDSPWKYYVDEVIYDFPEPPYRPGMSSPSRDHVRGIIREWRTESGESAFEQQYSQAIPLVGWGERFRTKRSPVYGKGSGVQPGTVLLPIDPDRFPPLQLLPHHPDFREPSHRFSGGAVRVEKKQTPTPSEIPPKFQRMTFVPHQVLSGSRLGGGKQLFPVDDINYPRKHRTTRLNVTYPRKSTRPPLEGLLRPTKSPTQLIIKRERDLLREAIKYLQKKLPESGSLQNLMVALEKTLSRSSSAESLRETKDVLECDSVSSELWDLLRSSRLVIPSELDREQTAYLEMLLDREPDVLLLTGNYLFLLILLVVNERLTTLSSTPHLIEELWREVIPWQLMTLGLAPEYGDNHLTGESTLQFSMVEQRLKSRTKALLYDLMARRNVSNVRFGQIVFSLTQSTLRTTRMWLVFQNAPGCHEMNTMLLDLGEMDSSRPAMEIIQDMISKRLYWGETHISELSQEAQKIAGSQRYNIMVADFRGLTGLWMRQRKGWVCVTRLDYRTRRVEDATILRWVTLRPLVSTIQIDDSSVRPRPAGLDSLVDYALKVIASSLKNCMPVRCVVSIDNAESMYSLEFHHAEKGPIICLLVHRTADVIEILRRPDYDCRPVFVDGHQFAWNRFKDIEYRGLARVLRPWVDRGRPFRSVGLRLPPNASDLLNAREDGALIVVVKHDDSVCPLAAQTASAKDQGKRAELIRRAELGPGTPARVMNESIYQHGSCWRISLSGFGIPEEVHELEKQRLTGPTLRSLIDSGALVYYLEGEWVVHWFQVLVPEPVPREFQESTYTMSIVRTQHVDGRLLVPLSYTESKETWQLKVSCAKGQVKFTLSRSLTEEIHEKRFSVSKFTHGMADTCGKLLLLSRSKVEKLLLEQLQSFVDATGVVLSEDRVEEVVDDYLETREVEDEGVGLTLVDVSISTDRFTQIRWFTARLQSSRGDEIEVQVVKIYAKDSWDPGYTGREDVEMEVENRLTGFNLSDGCRKEIVDIVDAFFQEHYGVEDEDLI